MVISISKNKKNTRTKWITYVLNVLYFKEGGEIRIRGGRTDTNIDSIKKPMLVLVFY